MRKILVYDMPIRIFHWLFAGLFLSAFLIAKTIDDESIYFSFHMLAGMTLLFLVILRILWGLWGTRHAKFSGFALHPRELVAYLRGIFEGDKRRWAGHNPASSWAGLKMMFLAMGLAVSGILMTTGAKEDFEDLHELFGNLFIIIVILHILGIFIHTIRHKDLIGLSMVNGKKAGVSADAEIPSTHPLVAAVGLVLVLLFAAQLFGRFNTKTGTLKVFGLEMHLSEGESEQGE